MDSPTFRVIVQLHDHMQCSLSCSSFRASLIQPAICATLNYFQHTDVVLHFHFAAVCACACLIKALLNRVIHVMMHAGVPHSHTKPFTRAKGRKFEKARGRRSSRGYKV